MSQTFRTASFIVSIALACLLASGCSQDKAKSFYNPTATPLPTPTISSVTPNGSAVAGIDTVTIKGTGFSTTLEENYIVFNSQAAQVVHATPTELKMIAPLLVGDSIVIRAAVRGSYDFSNKIPYALKPAVAVFGDLGATELATAITTDASGNVYTGFDLNGSEAGVLKFSTKGVRTVFAPKTGGDFTSLKMGPGGAIFGARNIRALYRFAPGGGAAAAVWAQVSSMFFMDCDFDQTGNLWAGGNNVNIYRFATDKSVTTYPFVGNIHSVRVFSGYLYFSAKTDAGEKIWRAPITAGGLGTPEIYFDFSTVYPQNVPSVMTFASDGTLYIGVNSSDGILVVTPGKTAYAPLTVYKQLFGKGVKAMTWGAVNDLYCSTVDGLLLKINITGKTSAPYYGAGL